MHPINDPNHKLLVWIVHPCHIAIHPSNDIDAYLLVFKKSIYLFICKFQNFLQLLCLVVLLMRVRPRDRLDHILSETSDPESSGMGF